MPKKNPRKVTRWADYPSLVRDLAGLPDDYSATDFIATMFKTPVKKLHKDIKNMRALLLEKELLKRGEEISKSLKGD